ncbi:MAG: hypothetical protein WDA22_13590 [Bacteroidota bacterium]
MKSNRSFFFFIVIIILSRLPLLFGGFGTDGDAWRIAKTALLLWNDGVYAVSRIPGFPLYEFFQAPIIALGGSLASNAASLVVFIISIVVFRNILRMWNIPHINLLVISYAFLPILWKNSAVTMDYVWGLLGILLSLDLLLKKKLLLAGVVLGLAAGTRITHIVFLLPFIFIFERTQRKQWLKFSAIAVLTTAVCYLPAVVSENYSFVIQDFLAGSHEQSMVKRISVFVYRIIFSIGMAGWIGIITMLIIQWKKIPAVFLKTSGTVSAAICLMTIAIFAFLPDEREYLIPMLPFLLILLTLVSERWVFVVITVLLLSYGFISIDLIEHSISQPRLNLNLQRGYIVKEYLGRGELNEKRMALSNATIPESSFVMIGMGPMFWLENPSVVIDKKMEKEFRHDCARSLNGIEIYFIYALYKPQLDEIRQRGYTVYYWTEMKEYFDTFIGYDLETEKILPID